MSFITIGIGVVQLFRLKSKDGSREIDFLFAKPIGAGFIVLGMATLVLGFHRFFKVQRMLQDSQYPASQLLVSLVVFAVILLVVVTMLLVFATRPAP